MSVERSGSTVRHGVRLEDPPGERCEQNVPVQRFPLGELDDVAKFTQLVFGSLTRSDQRRWAEVYLRGLLCCEGKKSVGKIAHTIVRLPVSQSLQQFINQSPWDWEPVRARLAKYVKHHFEPLALVVERAVIPKSGSHSVGVDRHFLPGSSRAVNCQIGLGTFIVSRQGTVPVNWRIELTKKWDEDERLRSRTCIPTEEIAQPEWQYVLEMVDEVSRQWGIDGIPVLVDATNIPEANQLAAALNALGVLFGLQVAGGFEIGNGNSFGSVPLVSIISSPLTERAYVISVDRYLEGLRRRNLPGVNWVGNSQFDRVESRFIAASVRIRKPAGLPHGPVLSKEIYQMISSTSARVKESTHWITNANRNKVAWLATLFDANNRAREIVRILGLQFGMHDFEGRSFPGWHHHMTLVSAAYALSKSQEIAE